MTKEILEGAGFVLRSQRYLTSVIRLTCDTDFTICQNIPSVTTVSICIYSKSLEISLPTKITLLRG